MTYSLLVVRALRCARLLFALRRSRAVAASTAAAAAVEADGCKHTRKDSARCAAPPPPTFKASKEPTITASRNFLSRLPLTYLLHSTSCKHTPPSLGAAAAAARHRHMPTKLSAAESPSSSFQAPALTPPPSTHQPSLFTALVPPVLLRWKHQLLSQRA